MDAMTRPAAAQPRPVSLLPVFLIVLVDVFGMTLVIPLLAIYAESFHASPLQATMLVSVFAACQLVSGPIIGHMSDRVGRKPMLIISQIGTFIGFIVMARARALWMLYLARVLDGATAGNLSLAQAYISDHTEPGQRAKSFGLIGIAFGVGFFIGPSLTGYLAGKYGMTTPIYLAAVMSATSILCTATLLKGGRESQHAFDDREAALRWKTYTKYFSRPGLRERLLQFLFFITSFSALHLRLRSVRGAALYIPGAPVRPARNRLRLRLRWIAGHHPAGGLIGRLVKWVGEPALVAVGFVTLVIGYFGLASPRHSSC
jgi:MFS family permease